MNTLSNYARVFDSNCISWTDNREWNLLYLKTAQTYFNDVLKTKGHVFLRDIYEYLGIPVTKTALIVGWVYNLKNHFADNFIDFGLEPADDESNIQMDFNVDGEIIKYFED